MALAHRWGRTRSQRGAQRCLGSGSRVPTGRLRDRPDGMAPDVSVHRAHQQAHRAGRARARRGSAGVARAGDRCSRRRRADRRSRSHVSRGSETPSVGTRPGTGPRPRGGRRRRGGVGLAPDGPEADLVIECRGRGHARGGAVRLARAAAPWCAIGRSSDAVTTFDGLAFVRQGRGGVLRPPAVRRNGPAGRRRAGNSAGC